MPSIKKLLRDLKWTLAPLLVAVAIMAILYVILPNKYYNFLWPVSVLLTAIATFLANVFLPEGFKDRVRYSANRVKLWNSDPPVQITFAANYSTNGSKEREIISETVRSELGVAPIGTDRFELSEETSLGTMEEVVNLDWSPIAETVGFQQSQSEPQVTNIRIKIRTDTQYNNITDALMTSYQKQNDLKNSLGGGLSGDGFSATCYMNEPVLIQQIMSKFDAESVSARTTDDVDIEFGEKQITVRDPGGQELHTVVDKLVRLVTYYG